MLALVATLLTHGAFQHSLATRVATNHGRTLLHTGLATGSAPFLARCRAFRLQQAEDAERAEEEEDELLEESDPGQEDSGVELVDAMTTSLNRDEELKPFPGPPIVEDLQEMGDAHPLFVCASLFLAGHMPSEQLQDAYHEWLVMSGDEVYLPHFMLSQQDFSDEMDNAGAVMTDEEVALQDAQAEEKAAAALAGEAIDEDEALFSGGGDVMESAGADHIDGEGDVWTMVQTPVQFMIGHLTVTQHMRWEDAEAWVASDPIGRSHGYEQHTLHQWVRSSDPGLRVASAGESQLSFAVHCLDKGGKADVRERTREKHLAWMRDSARVCMAGPLLDAPAVGGLVDAKLIGNGARVGSLLIVNGDSLEEVRAWAGSDPYNREGLFEQVTIAPIGTYGVRGGGGGSGSE